MDKPSINSSPAGSGENIRLIKCDSIRPDPTRPRGKYRDEDLSRLAKRFIKLGIGVPCVVELYKRGDSERYILLSGEKIFRAALIGGIKALPCVVLIPPRKNDDISSNKTFSPLKAPGKVVIHDARLFYNSVYHAVELMKRSGVDVLTEKQETRSHTVLTIAVPKSPPI